MKKVIVTLSLLLFVISLLAGQIIYKNKEQEWELVDVRSNDVLKAIMNLGKCIRGITNGTISVNDNKAKLLTPYSIFLVSHPELQK